jgi:hypothetical protein
LFFKVSFITRPTGLSLSFTGLFFLIKFLLKVKVLNKAFGLRVARFIAISAIIYSAGVEIRQTVIGEEGNTGTRNRRSLSLFLIICLLDHRVERDRRIIFGFDQVNGLSKGSNKDVVSRAESLEKAENELNLRKYNSRIEIL